MMKKTFCLILVSSSLFAMPCPNGGGPLYKGDSIDAVIRLCGAPNQQRTFIKKISSLKRWIYYRATPYHAGTSLLTILLKDKRIIGMTITERSNIFLCRQGLVQVGLVTTVQTSCGDWIYNTAYSTLCGAPIANGDSENVLLQSCGAPDQIVELESNVTSVTELVYSGNQAQTIVFEDGKLVEWR